MPVLMNYPPHDHHGVISFGAAEGLPSSEENIKKNTKTPPVHTVVVALCQNILWCNITWGPTKGVCTIAIPKHFGKPEIAKLDVPLQVQQQPSERKSNVCQWQEASFMLSTGKHKKQLPEYLKQSDG